MRKNRKDHTWKRDSLQSRNAKLTPEQRYEIGQKKSEGANTKDLAEEYGVSRRTVERYG